MKVHSEGSNLWMSLFTIGIFMFLGATPSASQDQIPRVEHEALVSIFRAAHGDRWKDTTGWLSPDGGRLGEAGTECGWEGVSCDEQKRHVIGLYLSDAGLAGVIPASIGDLTELQNLDLSFNRLQRKLPAELFRLRHLTNLNLSNNQLEGDLPLRLAGLASIEYLDLSRNYLTGPIRQVGALQTLEYLDLSENRFDGHLPSSLAALRHLQRLNLSDNHMTGVIPSQIGNMKSVRELALAHNRLSGRIPAALGRLAELQGLDVSYNHLTGLFPASFGMLQNLNWIGASHNALTGSFPARLCQAPLYSLDMSWNDLGGELTSAIRKCSSLAQLFLSHNKFKGRFPSSTLTSMESLETLDLSDNAFSGDLVDFRGPRLRSIHLDRNRFSGPIPATLIGDSLRELTLSANRLTGGVPQQLCSLESLRILDLSRNGLGGPMCDPDTSSGALEELVRLDLSHNRLVGTLPPQLFTLEKLAVLDLSFNLLTGPIPNSDLPTLQILNLSNNRMGNVVHFGEFPMLTSINLSHNQFTSGLGVFASLKSLRWGDISDNPWAEPIPLRFIQIEPVGMAAPALAITLEEARGGERLIPSRPQRPPIQTPRESSQYSKIEMLPTTRSADGKGVSLVGSVVDPAGAVVAGAEVVIESPAIGSKTLRTDSDGKFRFAVPADEYKLAVESKGFQRVQQQVQLQEGYLYTLSVTLALGVATKTITVAAEQPSRPGPWWNTWITKKGAPESGRESFLVPERQYNFYLELSAIQARNEARGETFKEIKADLRQRLLQLVRDGTPLQHFFVRVNIVGRAVQLSRSVTPVQTWSPSSQQWAPTGDSASSGAFESDLSNLFPDADFGRSPVAAPSGRAGAIQFGITAGKKPGCAAIAVSIWDETRMIPLDQLVRVVPVGQKTDCAAWSIENPTAPALYSDTARGLSPDVSLHVFEFKWQGKPHSASFMVMRNPVGTCKDYQWDSDATLSMQVLSGDEFTRDLAQARDANGSYAPVAKVLTNTVFAEADRSNICGAAAALDALKQLAQAGDVQMFARVSDDVGTLNVVPLGLMAMLEDAGKNVFPHDIRLTEPVTQESLEDTACISDWAFLLPSELDGFGPEELELPAALSDANVYRTLDEFDKRFVNAPDNDGPSGLLLLAHHLSGTLTTKGNDKLSFGQINRDLGQGSIAILSACKTGNLSDDTGMIRNLNEHGVDAMVATAFELDEKFGKKFAFNFAELVHRNTEPLTLEQAFEITLSKTGNYIGGIGFTPEQTRGMSLELVLAGNPKLKICPAKSAAPLLQLPER